MKRMGYRWAKIRGAYRLSRRSIARIIAPDTTKDDEYVALVDVHGIETKAEITFSDLQNVKAHFASSLLAGEYTLKVYTRSGLGEQFGVHMATRKVVVGG